MFTGFLKDIKKTVRLSLKSWKKVVLISVIEILFLISVFTILSPEFGLSSKISGHITQASSLLTEDINTVSRIIETRNIEKLNNEEVSYHLSRARTLTILMFFYLFVMWVLLKGTSWYIAGSIAGKKKINFFRYILRFAVLSTASLALFSLMITLYGSLYVYNMMFLNIIPGAVISSVFIVLCFFMIAISSRAYSLIYNNKLTSLFKVLRKRISVRAMLDAAVVSSAVFLLLLLVSVPGAAVFYFPVRITALAAVPAVLGIGKLLCFLGDKTEKIAA